MVRKTVFRTATGFIALTSMTACGAAGGEADGGGASADFPNESLRIVVPYPAGGGTDIAARAVAPCLESNLGESVIVENKTGGSGAVGTNELLSKPANGYTMGLALTSSAVVTPMSNNVGYSLKDLQPIGQVASFPYVIVVNGNSPYTDLESLLTSEKELTAAAPGAASQGTLELKAIKAAGAPLTIVPFDGTAGVKSAVMGNQVDFGTAVVDDDLLEQHKEGTLRILGVTSHERVPYLEDVPAVNEVPGYEDLGNGTSYFGLVVKAGTPKSITTVLSDQLEACMAKDSVQKIIGAQFVDENFVDGPALMQKFEGQAEAYADLINK